MTDHSMDRTRAVVLGGGYAGALAANRLQQNPSIDVTVVNPRAEFVHRVRLHEMVARSGEATANLAGLLGDGIHLIVDTAEKVNPAERTVELASGAEISYDYLIYAVGSTGKVPLSVPGAAQFSYPIGELEQAERLRSTLDETPPKARICVVGGGLTGIEAAAELAEQRPDVTVVLLCGGVLGPTLGERARASTRRQLERLNVDVQDTAIVAKVESDKVCLADGTVVPATVTIWTAGFGVPTLAADSGLRTDPMGRLLTDEALISLDDPRIVAAGDSAAPSGQSLRMSCQAAMPLAARAAGTVLDLVAGREPVARTQAFVGTNISIGRRYGTIQLSKKNDTPRGLYIGGKVAATIKEFVCTKVIDQIEKEGRRPGSYRWPGAKKQTVRANTPSGSSDLIPTLRNDGN
ncbi:NAD(P)/FAD-dependent oxidoreductase [Rhodococcus sp. P1Y]|uniref:NAD(P)/FAD-dependent oxidoreductase n=1 Tax=Rhodococcus sp. P1Y TaxID=1302308 RepID=UPI000EB07893|nr:FAD-dependent oxidoreductase [Rhodococcus sp. P1Y]AYJ51748.1 FAD-dependent oxidoreductase [Rhodococcus sp. P1Y]